MPGKKRPSLKAAIEWIAWNDNPGNGDSEEDVASYISTCLVADLFGQEPKYVAARIMLVREKADRDDAERIAAEGADQ